MLYPCLAKCFWCNTYPKNSQFARFYQSGISRQVHQFYAEVIRALQPHEVFLSGGEPLLYPDLPWFLNAIKDATKRIHLFTSFQFSAAAWYQIPFGQLPLGKMTLNHTVLYFEPERWHTLAAGFPFDVYLENLRACLHLSVRKRFKFIVNHSAFQEELERFQVLVMPDQYCELGLKIINTQGDGLNRAVIQQTRDLVNQRARVLDRLVEHAEWAKVQRRASSLDLMASVLAEGDVVQCPYRQDPLELRLAFFRATAEDVILKYRYCPYFPSRFSHRFHIRHDDPQKMEKNFYKGTFRDHCTECRFLQYVATLPKTESDNEGPNDQ